MKNILLITSAALLAACVHQPAPSKKIKQVEENGDIGAAILEQHNRKAAIAKAYCNGGRFSWYSESKYNYHFSCKDGGNFSLIKE